MRIQTWAAACSRWGLQTANRVGTCPPLAAESVSDAAPPSRPQSLLFRELRFQAPWMVTYGHTQRATAK